MCLEDGGGEIHDFLLKGLRNHWIPTENHYLNHSISHFCLNIFGRNKSRLNLETFLHGKVHWCFVCPNRQVLFVSVLDQHRNLNMDAILLEKQENTEKPTKYFKVLNHNLVLGWKFSMLTELLMVKKSAKLPKWLVVLCYHLHGFSQIPGRFLGFLIGGLIIFTRNWSGRASLEWLCHGEVSSMLLRVKRMFKTTIVTQWQLHYILSKHMLDI